MNGSRQSKWSQEPLDKVLFGEVHYFHTVTTVGLPSSIFFLCPTFCLDGYDDFETADDFLSNKPTPRARQLQKTRRTSSKNSYDDSSYLDTSVTKKEFLNNSSYDAKEQYDDDMYYENETETADTFVEMIDDEDNMIDDNENNIIKYRSSTQKLA